METFVFCVNLAWTGMFLPVRFFLPFWRRFLLTLSSPAAVTHKEMQPVMIKHTGSFQDLSYTRTNAYGFTQTFPRIQTLSLRTFLGRSPALAG